MSDEIRGSIGDDADDNAIGKNIRTSKSAGNVINFTAPESFAQNIYYVLLRIESKQDDQAERLGKLERWSESQTEKAAVQADRLRGIEQDVARFKEFQDESRADRKLLRQEFNDLKQQFVTGVQQVKTQVSHLSEPTLIKPKTWQWIALAIIALWLTVSVILSLPDAIRQILQLLP